MIRTTLTKGDQWVERKDCLCWRCLDWSDRLASFAKRMKWRPRKRLAIFHFNRKRHWNNLQQSFSQMTKATIEQIWSIIWKARHVETPLHLQLFLNSSKSNRTKSKWTKITVIRLAHQSFFSFFPFFSQNQRLLFEEQNDSWLLTRMVKLEREGIVEPRLLFTRLDVQRNGQTLRQATDRATFPSQTSTGAIDEQLPSTNIFSRTSARWFFSFGTALGQSDQTIDSVFKSFWTGRKIDLTIEKRISNQLFFSFFSEDSEWSIWSPNEECRANNGSLPWTTKSIDRLWLRRMIKGHF